MTQKQTRLLTLGILMLFVIGGAWLWRSELREWWSSARKDTAYAVGPFQITTSFQPDPPRVGTNTLTLTIQDADGQPVEDAAIDATASMPAMGAMPEMRSQGQVTAEGTGRYRLVFDLSMAGSWPLTLNIRTPDGREAGLPFNFVTGLPVRRTDTPSAPSEAGSGKDDTGTLVVDAARRQLIGVKTAPVVRKEVVADIRALGRVTYDETRLTDITLKYRGWLGKVFADYTGITVTKGKPLFTLYSPELLSAQEEFLESLRRAGAVNGRHRSLLDTTRRRLRLWNLTESQITRLAETRKPKEYMPVLSPVTGTVIEKHVVAGSAVEPGMRLYRVADLSRVWVEADLYESDIPLVKIGQTAKQTLAYLPGKTFTGRVAYLYPYLDATTRTGSMRIDMPNPNGTLKPNMYVNVALQIPLGNQLVVPESAVIMAGKTNLVFVDRGSGRLQPQRLTLGRKVHAGFDGFVVLDGLKEGDIVVTSGNFLIASESRLKAGVDKW
jgi:Cu(I)/Ag(I) efflux system membrane fusion protein